LRRRLFQRRATSEICSRQSKSRPSRAACTLGSFRSSEKQIRKNKYDQSANMICKYDQSAASSPFNTTSPRVNSGFRAQTIRLGDREERSSIGPRRSEKRESRVCPALRVPTASQARDDCSAATDVQAPDIERRRQSRLESNAPSRRLRDARSCRLCAASPTTDKVRPSASRDRSLIRSR